MAAYEHYRTAMAALYDKLDGANHSVSLTLHIMETDRDARSISDYENALDVAKAVRAAIGALHDDEMRQRSADAWCVAIEADRNRHEA